MTYSTDVFCAWCGGAIENPGNVGRPRRFCRRSHRQRAYEARSLARRGTPGPDHVLVSLQGWERLSRALEGLQTAAGTLAANADPTTSDLSEAVGRLGAAVAVLQGAVELDRPR